MSSFLDLDAAQRQNAIAIAADKCGLAAVSVEKDYMVCSALRVLFSVPDASAHLTFKGGTSLSKAYGLIERFSEDVDIVVAREYIGVKPVPDDLSSLTRSAKSKYVKAVQQSLEHWIQNVAAPYFSNAPRLSDGSPLWTCRIDDATKHRDTLLLEYVSVIDGPAPAYIRPSVRLEFGARADRWPRASHDVLSYSRRRLLTNVRRDMPLVPDENQHAQWLHDYEQMRENMLFGDSPDFATIIAVMEQFASQYLRQ